MFHKSNFGSFGTTLPSDQEGYVPEEGDDVDDFTLEGDMTEDEWLEFVAEAVQATQEAEQALATWRAT